MGLDDLERMGAADQRRELAVGQDRQVVGLAGGLADPLVLVQRRDAAGVVADHHVRPRLLHRDLHLAVDREGAGELALGNDVAEAEAAAVVPGRIVDHLGAQGADHAGRDRDPVPLQDIVVVDRVLRHHLVDVAGRVDGRADGAGVDRLARRDPVAHDVHPFGIVHDLFRDQQLAVDQPVQLGEDFLHPFAQFRGVQQVVAHLLVVAERRAAMDQRIVVGVGQALGAGADIGLMEIAQEDGGQALQVADARAVIVPGGAGGLVGLVEIFDAELVHQPEQRGRIARNVAALAAGFVVPEPGRRDALGPAVERLDLDRRVAVADPVDGDLAVFLQLPHDIAHVLDAVLVGQHGALVDLRLDPGGRGARVLRRQIRIAPLAAVAGKAFAAFARGVPGIVRGAGHIPCLLREPAAAAQSSSSSSSSCSSRKSSQSSRFSSMMSVMTSNRFSSIPSSWSRTPVISQIV